MDGGLENEFEDVRVDMAIPTEERRGLIYIYFRLAEASTLAKKCQSHGPRMNFRIRPLVGDVSR